MLHLKGQTYDAVDYFEWGYTDEWEGRESLVATFRAGELPKVYITHYLAGRVKAQREQLEIENEYRRRFGSDAEE